MKYSLNPRAVIWLILFLFSKSNFNTHQKSSVKRKKKPRIHNIECYEIELQGESLLVVSIFPQVMNQSASLTNVWKSVSSSSWYGKSWLPSPNSDFKSSLEWWGQGTPRWFGCGDGTGRWSGYGQLSQLFLMFNFPLTTAYSNLDVHTFLLGSTIGRKILWNYSVSICHDI